MQAYELIEKIGEGDNSEVLKMKRKLDDKIVVCKKIYYGAMDPKQKHQLVEQVNILRELKSNHIVKYFEHLIDKTTFHICVIMEHCEGGDLQRFLDTVANEKKYLPEDSIWKIVTQVFIAINEIHKRKQGTILHRDIKPANIFLDSNQNVKLGDFGVARRLNSEEHFAKTKINQTYYLSPEQLKEGIFTEKTDIWACGCLLYQMACLRSPFHGDNQLQIANNIKNGSYLPIPSNYSRELQRVIKWCLSKNPSDRPNIDELITLPEVSRRLREKRLTDNTNLLEQREQLIRKKQKQLKQLEQRLKERQRLVNKEFRPSEVTALKSMELVNTNNRKVF